MNIIPEKRLFWFLKEGTSLDFNEPSMVDMYVQQVLTRGMTEDVRVLLTRLKKDKLKDSIDRIKRFLPYEVKYFWEDFF